MPEISFFGARKSLSCRAGTHLVHSTRKIEVRDQYCGAISIKESLAKISRTATTDISFSELVILRSS